MPFEDIISNDNSIYRIFSSNTESADLVWHRDKFDRWVTILEANGWQLQIDNQLPIVMEIAKTYFIPGKTFHRIIKGTGMLSIQIKENKNI